MSEETNDELTFSTDKSIYSDITMTTPSPIGLVHEVNTTLTGLLDTTLFEADASIEYVVNDTSSPATYIITNSTSPINVTLAYNNSVEPLTSVDTAEMYPYMDEHVGNYIALGFLFAFLVSVIILISVVIYCCLKRRKKIILEKSMTRIENPKYSSQPSKYPQSFDFLSSQNVRAEFRNSRDEPSAILMGMDKRSPHVTISIDDPSSGTSLYSSESNKAEYKRLSGASDFPAASLVSIRNNSEASIPVTIGNENLSPSDCSSPTTSKNCCPVKGPIGSPRKRKFPTVTSPSYELEKTDENSETPSWPLLGTNKSKNFGNRLLKSKESEINRGDVDDNDDEGDDDDENMTNQSTSLLKSKEQSMTSLGSYDQSLNPFCN